MDVVLGVSMAPSAVQMVLVEGENADGVTVDEDDFDVDAGSGNASDRVVSAILGTRESAREGGYRLTSTGVTVGDQAQARMLRGALTDRKLGDVMLVPAFLAAAALTQTVGGAIGYQRTALLLVEPDSATLAVVDSADGSIAEARRTALPADDDSAVAELAAMAAQVGGLPSSPDGVFVVGSGVNVGMIKSALEEAARPLPLSVPEEPEMALARGAALASAHAVLFDSSTSAVAWARDPGTGMIDPDLVALSYAFVSGASGDPDATVGEQALAYSAVGDNDPESGYLTVPDGEIGDYYRDPALPGDDQAATGRKPFLLAGTTLATLFVVGVASLVVALAIGIRPTAVNQPVPGQHIVVPARQAPPPAPKVQLPAPPAAPPAAPAPQPQHVPAPAAPAPAPAAPAPAPAPIPVAPAPIPVPIPVQVPVPEPARVPSPPPAAPPSVPKNPVPTVPPIFNPPKQVPPESGGKWPGSPGNGGGPPLFPGFPGKGGDDGGPPLFPGFPGSGGHGGGWGHGDGGGWGHGDGGGRGHGGWGHGGWGF